MSPAELLALIDAQAAVDPVFSEHVSERNDAQIAALLPPIVTAREHLITKRGLRAVLGAAEGRAFLTALRAYAAASAALPDNDDLWWLAELLPAMEASATGIDIGNAETRAALRGLAAVGPALNPAGPNVTDAHCDALEAASNDVRQITWQEVAAALGSL